MKKTFILFALSLGLLSCSSNDSNEQVSKTENYFKASLNGKVLDYSSDDSNSSSHSLAFLNGYMFTTTQFEKAYYAGCAMYPSTSLTGYPQIALTFNGLYTNSSATTLSDAFYNSFKTIPTNFITEGQANIGGKGIDITYQLADGTIYSTLYGSQTGSSLLINSSTPGIEEGGYLKTQSIEGTVSCKLYNEDNVQDVIQLTDGKFKLIFREFN